MTTIQQIQTLAGVTADGIWGPITNRAFTAANGTQLMAIQGILGVSQDGIWGPMSEAALQAVISPVATAPRSVMASSFADPADVAAFRACKARGRTDEECFQVGDNGIGYWGDDTTEGSGPSCALPPEIMDRTWGSVSNAHLKPVLIVANGKSVTALIKDTMPRLADITNGAGIDCNADTVLALGMTPPMMVAATWQPA